MFLWMNNPSEIWSLQALSVFEAIQSDEADWVFRTEKVDLLQCSFKDWQKVLLQVLVISQFFSLLNNSWCFFRLLTFLLLDPCDLSNTMPLQWLHLLDEVINILEIVKQMDFDHKTTFVCDFLVETAVDMSIVWGEVNLMGKIVNWIYYNCLYWVDFIDTGWLSEDGMPDWVNFFRFLA